MNIKIKKKKNELELNETKMKNNDELLKELKEEKEKNKKIKIY